MTTSLNRQDNDRTKTNSADQKSNFTTNRSRVINQVRGVLKTTFNKLSNNIKIILTAQKVSETQRFEVDNNNAITKLRMNHE